MTYSPPLAISQRLPADSLWSTIVDNHSEVQRDYAPAIIDQYLAATSTSTSYADRIVWMVRKNAALSQIRVRVYAKCSVGNGTVRVLSGAASNDVAVSGTSFAWYTVDVTPTTPDSACVMRLRVTSGGHSLEVGAVQVYLLPTPGVDVAGWVEVSPSRWSGADNQVPSRVCEDLLNGVVLIARDRPYCLASRVSDLAIPVAGKTAEAWGAENTAAWTPVGRLLVPRPYAASTSRLDAYVTRDGGTAQVRVGIGSATWGFSAASDGWYTTTLRLPETVSDAYVNIIPGASDGAAVRSLQIWRGGV